MKMLLLASLMIIGTSNVFAQSMTCQIDTLMADKAGYLMPSDEKLSIRTKIGDCEKVSRENLQLLLCVSEANFVGGYIADLTIKNINDSDYPTSSRSALATLKNGKGLTEINSQKSVLLSFNDKLAIAGISTVSFLEYDSAALDESVKQGMAKGILTPNEPVVISVGECKLDK